MRYVLVDRFLEIEKGTRARAVKCVTKGEPFMADRDHYPSPLVLEALFQVGGAVLRSDTQFTRLSALGKVERAEFPACARAGDTIERTVEATVLRPEGMLCHGVAKVGDVVVAEADYMMLLVPPELQPPEDKQRMRHEYLRRRALRMPVELEAK